MPDSIELRLGPSLRLFYFSFGIAALLAVTIGIAAVGFKFKFVVLLALVIYSWQILRVHAFLQSPDSPLHLKYEARHADQILVTDRKQTSTPYRLQSSTFIHPQLTILALRPLKRSWSPKHWIPRCVLLCPDNCDPTAFRRLRTSLLHRAIR
ncbi:protein YgfX [Allohahella marinimesophila]|uniref:Toxin CptA n=1 Tax=Allohahella marinimesophila TaxID=1054972 RepID=A0ABP7Q7K2_9GAMM